jgi:hypothetical protein
MMKKWHEEKPFTFGIVFLISFIFLDVTDAKWFIPRMRPICNGEITDQQARACSGWIKKINKKEQSDVRITERRPRQSSRYTPTDGYVREQERAITDFGGGKNR